MIVSLEHYLCLSAIIFTLGVFGIFLNRKNVITILMSIELMLLAVNINLVSFSKVGQTHMCSHYVWKTTKSIWNIITHKKFRTKI